MMQMKPIIKTVLNHIDSNDLFEDNGDDEVINNGLYGTVHNNCAYFYS